MRTIGGILFVLGLGALLYLCLGQQSQVIEDDIRNQARSAIRKAALPDVVADADGRDVILTGQVATEAERDRALKAASVFGARVVRDELQAVRRPSFQVSATEDGDAAIKLTGIVPTSATRTAIHKAASSLYGMANVTNTLEVAKGGTARGLETSVVEGLTQLHTQVLQGSLTADVDSLRIEGKAASADTTDTVVQALKAKVLSSTEVKVNLAKADQPTAGADTLLARIQQKKDEVVVSGVFPNAENREDLLKAVRRTFKNIPVVDQTSIAGLTGPRGFGSGAKASLQWFDEVSWATVEQDSKGLRFSGLGKPELAGNIKTALRGALPTGQTVEVTVEPAKDVDTCQADINAILAADTILFDSGSARISKKSHPLLDNLAHTLSRCPAATLAIQGHTDSQGDATMNKVLSRQRADAVRSHLTGLGLDAARATSAGFGEDKPIADNGTPAGRAKNRRIAFVLDAP